MNKDDNDLWKYESRVYGPKDTDWTCEICEEDFREDEPDAAQVLALAGTPWPYDKHSRICAECYMKPDPRQDLGDENR